MLCITYFYILSNNTCRKVEKDTFGMPLDCIPLLAKEFVNRLSLMCSNQSTRLKMPF